MGVIDIKRRLKILKSKHTQITLQLKSINKTSPVIIELFIKHSIPSPFVSEKVDPQRVLPLDQFIVPEETKQPEPTLFEFKEAI